MNRCRILVVDSNDDDLKLIIRTFESHGEISYQAARDGEEAMRTLETDPLPDLVIMAHRLRLLSGADLLRQIRGDERLRNLRVFVATNAAHPDVLREFEEIGVSGVLVKALDPAEFMRSIASVLTLC